MAGPLTTLTRAGRVVRLRLRSLVAGRRLDAELDDELAFHAAMAEEDARARGGDPAAARLAATRRIDGLALRRDECRDARGLAWLDALRQDLRHAFRGLRRTPLYSTIAIASLGLGLGATASLFAVVDAVLVRPLPFPDAERVVWLGEWRHDEPSSGTPQRLADWARVGSVAAIGGYYGDEPFVRTASGDLGRLPSVRTFGRFFEVLGLSPVAGRLPTDAEARGTGPSVVLLSERAWRTRFAGRPDAVGTTLRIDRTTATIIGVLPEAAEALTDGDLWLPAPPELQASAREAGFLAQVARLAPGRSLEAAQAEVSAVAGQLAVAHPGTDRGLQARLVPLRTHLGRDARTPLLLLLATVASVLLVASLNVASLMLARGLSRLRDASLRVAIGAGRARLLQLHLLESGLLAGGGALLGLGLAWFGVDVLRLLLPAMPGLATATIDVRLIAVTAGLAIVCAAIVGVLPALVAWRAAAAPALREGGRSVSGLARSRTRSALVVGQIAVAVVLLVGAGLLARALAGLQRVPLGFESAGTLTFRVPLSWDSDAARIADVTETILGRLRAAPGVRAAGIVDRLPFGGGSQTTAVVVDGVALPPDLVETKIAWRTASAGFFAAIGVPLRRGELYPDSWRPGDPRVAVVNERFVRLFLGGRDPVGLEVGGYRRGDGTVPRYRIVGVVGDLRTAIDEPQPMAAVYVPAGATFWPILNVAARVDGDPSRLLPVVRTLAADLAPDVVVEDVAPLDARVAEALREPRTRTWIVVAFAGVALLLAAIGLYGVLAGEVTARVKEIGIRLALGASPGQVLAATLRRGLGLALLGLGLGAVAARGAGRLLTDLLAGRDADDWRAFAGACAVLLMVAAVASLAPAWRAARIDPNRALRTD